VSATFLGILDFQSDADSVNVFGFPGASLSILSGSGTLSGAFGSRPSSPRLGPRPTRRQLPVSPHDIIIGPQMHPTTRGQYCFQQTQHGPPGPEALELCPRDMDYGAYMVDYHGFVELPDGRIVDPVFLRPRPPSNPSPDPEPEPDKGSREQVRDLNPNQSKLPPCKWWQRAAARALATQMNWKVTGGAGIGLGVGYKWGSAKIELRVEAVTEFTYDNRSMQSTLGPSFSGIAAFQAGN
jgi:hypothetical protein